jgi:hypothetical protein
MRELIVQVTTDTNVLKREKDSAGRAAIRQSHHLNHTTTNQPISQSANQPISQSANQPISQSANHVTVGEWFVSKVSAKSQVRREARRFRHKALI